MDAFTCSICKKLIVEEIEGKNKVIYITENGTREVCFECDRKERSKEGAI